jgi:hypothetical protein
MAKAHPLINVVCDGKIFCVKCGGWKEPEKFSLSPRMRRGRHSWCHGCMAAGAKAKMANMTKAQREAVLAHRRVTGAKWSREWRAKNFERSAQSSRKYRYGLTQDQYDQRVGGQGGDHLHVDHDHTCCSGRRTCGKCLRSLVCWHCNLIMGLSLDDPARLRAIAAYLEAWNGQRLKDIIA